MTIRIALSVFLVVLVCAPGPATAGSVASSFTVRADWFERGNVRVSAPGQSYADKHACIWNGGQRPNQAEYDIDFPVTADYTLVALYTAQASRPVDVYLDAQKVHQGFSGVTGSWQTEQARWETQCTIRVVKGVHTLKLVSPGACMPHICAFRLESSAAFPPGWRLNRPAAQRARRTVEQPANESLAHLVPELPLLARDDVRAEMLSTDELDQANGGLNDELAAKDSASPSPTTPWVARLTVPREPAAVLDLDPARLETMLRRTIEWIDDFRAMPGVAPDFLDAQRAAAREKAGQLSEWRSLPDDRSKWERFLSLYLSASKLQREVARANPLVDFDRLLLVRRGKKSPRMGLPQNWQSNCVLPLTGFDDEIAVLSSPWRQGALTTLYRPDGGRFVGDLDLHFDGDRLLFSSIGTHERWQIFEIRTDGSGLRQVTPGDQDDVDNYDACYLPDGRVLFCSTASMVAVPCVNGSTRVANLYGMNADGSHIRQLCFDQEHNWCPTPLANGRVMYLRWEYTDTPHAHTRVLFQMNPDGTGQMEYYGSNSYWPNALFYARPIPQHPSKFVGIVGGHHGVPRMGELVLFDPALGRREAEGVIQRIPGRGRKVEPKVEDRLVDDSWPKFLHPFPLSEKYFLVAAQPTPESAWGIYLADVFDNLVLIKEQPDAALLEPMPLRKTPRPPAIPDRVDLARNDGLVYLSNIYAGDGLKGIPPGTVKKLRLISYHYLYPKMGGPQGVVGMEGPWDIKRVIGTVPVESDGSALFRVPANTPIAVQPLDSEGKALQLMRSWFTAMPGEVLSCVGCHESQNSAPPGQPTRAMYGRPATITPWRGPVRGFSFPREVQPVLDAFCVSCHDGKPGPDGRIAADLRGLEQIADYASAYHSGRQDAGHFSTSYVELHRFVRRPGLESDYHLLTPMEFHADTTELVQLLARGHYGVQLDEEAWDRLITWIDLNAPFHGTWKEIAGDERVAHLAQRRRDLRKLYANMHDDPEEILEPARLEIRRVERPSPGLASAGSSVGRESSSPGRGWPWPPGEAQRRQAAAGPIQWQLPLADGLALDMIRIPAGEFVMGDAAGYADESPACKVRIERPFWIGRFELTNRQFAAFDPAHDSMVESRFAMQFGVRGFYVDGPEQPVVRVSWSQAMDFCRWLSARTGRRFSLPTEAQWEYACRAGSGTAFNFGGREADFSLAANLADATLSEFVCHPYKKERLPLAKASRYDDWIPKDSRFNDGGFVSENVGRYAPNVWGLHDMHGNVWEWTRSDYLPYPYHDDDRNELSPAVKKVARGGSWRDRPVVARSSTRLAYRPYQCVYNVGFRVVCEE